jgi:hypothetical protein
MPLTLTITDGVLPPGQEKVAFERLTQAMLVAHNAVGNAVMTRNVVGSLHVVPRGTTFTGAVETTVVFIEWKVPAFAFADEAVQKQYYAAASDIIDELSGGRHPRDNTYINVVHTVDGAWNFEGVRMTNAEIGARVAQG